MRPRRPSPGAYSRRRQRARDKVRAQNRNGLIILGLSAFAAIGLFLGAAAMAEPEVNPVTGCPKDVRAAEAHTLVLIDETDRLASRDLKFAEALIRTEYLWLPIGGKLTVRNIVADPNAAEDIVICRMDDGSGVLGIARNKAKVEQTFRKIAGRKLDDLFAALAAAEPQDASPIFEAIVTAPERADFGSGVRARRLVVLSDFAQHSDLFSQYGSAAEPDEEVLEAFEADLTNVDVRLQYVTRRDLAALQGRAHKAFWKEQLETMGARVEIGHDLHLGEDPTKETWTNENL